MRWARAEKSGVENAKMPATAHWFYRLVYVSSIEESVYLFTSNFANHWFSSIRLGLLTSQKGLGEGLCSYQTWTNPNHPPQLPIQRSGENTATTKLNL